MPTHTRRPITKFRWKGNLDDQVGHSKIMVYGKDTMGQYQLQHLILIALQQSLVKKLTLESPIGQGGFSPPRYKYLYLKKYK